MKMGDERGVVEEMKEQLLHTILPFWKQLKDETYGGFYGLVDYELQKEKKAEKGVILHSRILWFFSNAHMVLQQEEELSYAKHAYEFLKNNGIDHEMGGVFWSVTYDGKPADTTKHTYAIAFAIYALSSYYEATKEKEALQYAFHLYEVIESRCRDQVGYLESFDRGFRPIPNEKLSENGLMASKTYNTLLHVWEAYTMLYQVSGNEEVAGKMRWILAQFVEVLYNKDRHRMEVFFDADMKSISNLHSYGHDIETAWLLDYGCQVLGNPTYIESVGRITKELTECVYQVAFDGHSLNNECFEGVVDRTKLWWVQAEAVVGFLNGYEKEPTNKNYYEAAKSIWGFIQENMIDQREGSEWFYDLNEEGKPVSRREIAGPWKCPYHNGRMCFEVIKRANKIELANKIQGK